ncbi:MAG: hypothetical protein ABI741_07335 [Ferruginibacter sp.]
MKNLYFLLSFCILILLSCSKHCDQNLTDQKLAGSWKWVKTDGGIGYNIHDTPASTGKNIDVKFTTDNHYAAYTNGALTSQGSFNLQVRNCIHDHTNKNVIIFSSPEDQAMMIESLDNLTLQTSDDVYDGTISVYSRN